jgi:hypothetical protein
VIVESERFIGRCSATASCRRFSSSGLRLWLVLPSRLRSCGKNYVALTFRPSVGKVDADLMAVQVDED